MRKARISHTVDRIYAVVPAYNVGTTILHVVRELLKHLNNVRIVVVDDGSTDETESLMRAQKNGQILYFRHNTNQGKGAALQIGINAAISEGASIIFTIDADGQHAAMEAGKLLNVLKSQKADMVIGDRMQDRESMPPLRVVSNLLTSRLVSWRIGCDVPDSQSGYRLFRAYIFENLSFACKHFDFETELILKAGLNGYTICSTRISTLYNTKLSSSIRFVDVLRFILVFLRSYFWRTK